MARSVSQYMTWEGSSQLSMLYRLNRAFEVSNTATITLVASWAITLSEGSQYYMSTQISHKRFLPKCEDAVSDHVAYNVEVVTEHLTCG